jgi:hypothetical protein
LNPSFGFVTPPLLVNIKETLKVLSAEPVVTAQKCSDGVGKHRF